MEATRDSFDRRSDANHDRSADQPRPRVSLLIRTRDLTSAVESMETIAVTRPSGPVQQRDQLVRAVKDHCPSARLHRVSEAGALFTCGSCVVTASYGSAF